MGRGDKNAADGAAVDAMRLVLNTVPMDGVVVIGEGEKDEAPMLYNGEQIGDGTPPEIDIAVDPIDGTTLTSLGRGNAIAVIAVARAGHDVRPRPVRLHGEDRRRSRAPPTSIDINAPVKANLEAVAKALGREGQRRHRGHPRPRPPRRHHPRVPRGRRPHPAHPRRRRRRRDLRRVAQLRHRHPVRHRRHARGRDRRVPRSSALGGAIQGRLWPRNDDERDAALDAGYDLDQVLTTDDLVSGDDVFFAATGITDGELLQGVRYWGDGASTRVLVMRSKSGTIRMIEATHRWTKLMRYSAVSYELALATRSHPRGATSAANACARSSTASLGVRRSAATSRRTSARCGGLRFARRRRRRAALPRPRAFAASARATSMSRRRARRRRRGSITRLSRDLDEAAVHREPLPRRRPANLTRTGQSSSAPRNGAWPVRNAMSPPPSVRTTTIVGLAREEDLLGRDELDVQRHRLSSPAASWPWRARVSTPPTLKNACSGTSSSSPLTSASKRLDRLLDRHVDAGQAGEHLADEERLRQEPLDLAGPGDGDRSSSESSSRPRMAMMSWSSL